MESQRAKRAIKPPKKYTEDEGSWGVDTSTLLTLLGCQQCLVAWSQLYNTCFVHAERPARDTPEAEQPMFVYRLLKKKEVNKDLVHQEVQI